MATVIDSLIVTLGLDPAKFSAGTKDAQSKLEKFNETVKKLGIDEAKLTKGQKEQLDALRKLAVQSEKTKKELAAATTVGDEFWGVMKKGALAFGAAFGVEALRDMGMASIGANAGLLRVSATLGMQGPQLDRWVKAVRALSGGSGEGAAGTLSSLSALAQGATMGDMGAFQSLNRLRYFLGVRTGVNIPVMKDRTHALGADEILQGAIPAIQKLGVQGALTAFQQAGVPIDIDTLTALAKGPEAFSGGLAAAGAKTLDAKGMADAEEAARQLNSLSDAIGHLKDALTLLAVPRLTRDVQQFEAMIQFAQGKISPAEFDRRWQAAEDQFQGPAGVAKAQTQAAYDALNAASPQQYEDPASVFARAHPRPGQPPTLKTWTKDQRMARLGQLIAQGRTPDQAVLRVMEEEATGAPPGARPDAAAPAGMDALLDSVHRREGNGTSPKGAQGPYQFMPGTWKDWGNGGNVFDPKDSRDAARRYLTYLMKRFGSTEKALAAYNWGPAALDQDIAAHGDDWARYLPHETAAYIPGVLGTAQPIRARETSITHTGDIVINVPSGDPSAIAGGWHKALADHAKSTGAN